MSAIDDVVGALQQVVDKLNEAASAAAAASAETDQALAQAVALGTATSVAALASLKDNVDGISTQANAVAQSANEAINQAKGIASST